MKNYPPTFEQSTVQICVQLTIDGGISQDDVMRMADELRTYLMRGAINTEYAIADCKVFQMILGLIVE